MRTILCVDDHPSALYAISMLLKSRGYHCLVAATPDEALQLLRSNHVELAVVDHWLPATTGSELARALKRIKNIPIILITGDPDLKQAPESVDLLLGKPQNPEELLGFVAALLPGHE